MLYLNLFIITTIIVIVLDLSGISQDIKRFISKWLTKGKIDSFNYSIKPFDCSYCMSFWCNLLFIILTNQFSLLNVLVILLLSESTPIIKDVIILVKQSILKLINVIYDKLGL